MNREIYLILKSHLDNLKSVGRSKETIKLLEKRICTIFDLSDIRNIKNIKNLKYSDALAIRDKLYQLPKNASKIKEFNGLSKNEIIELNNRKIIDKYQTIAIDTVDGYLSAISDFFDWCINNGLLDKNHFKNLKKKRKSLVRPNKKGREFDCVELNEISKYLHSKYKPEDGYKYYIVPLLRYTGARLNELIQMSYDDIRIVDGVYCIDIYPDQYKTKNSGRTIPIHPKLIDIGFLDYIKSKNGDLFPETHKFKKCRTDGVSKWSKRWRDKMNLKEGKNLRSFRHNFIDELKKRDVDLEVRAQLAGHRINVTADVYSKDYSMKEMYKYICLIGKEKWYISLYNRLFSKIVYTL